MTKELNDTMRKLSARVKDLEGKLNNVVDSSNDTVTKLRNVAEHVNTVHHNLDSLGITLSSAVEALGNQMQTVEASVRLKTVPASEYSEMLSPIAVGSIIGADQDMQQELFKCDERIVGLLAEKSRLYKRVKELEVEIKIVESHEIMTPEFAALKNAPQRDAARRLASEEERKEKARLEGELEDITNRIYEHKNYRESCFAGLYGIRAKVELTSSIFRYLGGN